MQRKNLSFAAVFVIFFSITIFLCSVSTYAASTVMKEGSEGKAVTALQKDLKALGFFSGAVTGYYGEITVAAVKKIQKKYGLKSDGVAGDATILLINKLLGKKSTTVSRGDSTVNKYLTPWFGGAEDIFSIGKKATVYDVDTGLSFKVRRSYGYNHADCEALTASDAAIMKKVFGGTWNWDRRAVIVTVDGKKIAGSMAGMPHAGSDKLPGDIYIESRSDGYGAGVNLDEVKGNNMDGHFDIHFLGSRTHGTNKVDAEHQSMVKKAAAWALKNSF